MSEEQSGKERRPPAERIGSGFRALMKQARTAIILFLILTLVVGIAYPLAVTGISQVLFPHQANGSLVTDGNGTAVGSELIGQSFTGPEYFWGRLSASDYDASASGGTNYGSNSSELEAMVRERVDDLNYWNVYYNITDPGDIPSDLVTASGSGLDPDISYASALYQLPRVAAARGMSEQQVLSFIQSSTTADLLTGNKLVNVLDLNLALDGAQGPSAGGGSAETLSSTPNNTLLGLTLSDWLYVIIFAVILFPLAWSVGKLIAGVYDEGPGRFTGLLVRAERKICRSAKADGEGMSWKMYLLCLLTFNVLGIAALMLIMTFQDILPLNPGHLGPVPLDLAFNTSVSFVTNTNWQAYSGESTMSYFTQMVGLTVQNFLSAATGLAVLIALIRGIRNRSGKDIGNYWADLTKATMVLLPISFIIALILVSQGCVQTLDGPVTAQLINPYYDASGNLVSTQTIAVGPVASQEAVKLLGTNGGGFFNANSAHPFENPTSLTNLIETITILLIPAGLCLTFGRMIKDRQQGIAILAVMVMLFAAFASVSIWAETGGNEAVSHVPGVSQMATVDQLGGNLEGKEMRFGVVPSCLFVIAATATSCGAVNSMLDSYTPIGGMCPLLLMQFGEVVFGGIGSGLYGMLVFVIVAVFIAGLMIGRMPEYLGKKIGPYEMKLCTMILIVPIVTVLIGTAIAVMVPEGRSAVLNSGPHGFTEILYAFTSAGNNNGSAFAGLAANSLFFNIALAAAMLIGRFATVSLTLALAGSMSEKKVVPPGPGTLPTHTFTFIIWLIGVIVLLGALSYFLTLALGPIVEVLI